MRNRLKDKITMETIMKKAITSLAVALGAAFLGLEYLAPELVAAPVAERREENHAENQRHHADHFQHRITKPCHRRHRKRHERRLDQPRHHLFRFCLRDGDAARLAVDHRQHRTDLQHIGGQQRGQAQDVPCVHPHRDARGLELFFHVGAEALSDFLQHPRLRLFRVDVRELDPLARDEGELEGARRRPLEGLHGVQHEIVQLLRSVDRDAVQKADQSSDRDHNDDHQNSQAMYQSHP